MPHHKACKKQVRTSATRNTRNRMAKSRIHTATKKVLGANTGEEASAALVAAYSAIDRAAKHNVIHNNTAANKKARLARAVQRIAG